MENHPIPQDITGFQFKLIGNMTVKQFAYLAAGLILGWIGISLPILFIIKFPIALFFAFLGISFAFLPIDGRPLDVMFTNFIKALSNSTQYVYQQEGAEIYFPDYKINSNLVSVTASLDQKKSISNEKLKTFLASLPLAPKNKLDEKEMVFLQSLTTYADQSIQQPQTQASIGISDSISSILGFKKKHPQQIDRVDEPKNDQETEPDVAEAKNIQDEAQSVKDKLEEAKKIEAKQASGTKEQEVAHQKVVELEKLLNETVLQKQQLENQLIEMQKKLEQQNKKIFTPSIAEKESVNKQTKHVRSIPKDLGKSIGLPISSDFPNVLTGIIKDSRGNPLHGILVEVKDTEGNPIRAFKTNPLGQFASATPLSNGTYTIDFEDPSKKHQFDTIQFSASGEIILPIEVISIDEREELRKSLFGQ